MPECSRCKGQGRVFNHHTPEFQDPYEWCYECLGTGWQDAAPSKEQPDFDTVLHSAQEALTHIVAGTQFTRTIVREGARTYREGNLFDCVIHDQREREPWHLVWMQVAHTIARRSYDNRLKVGAIIVPEDNTGILALGYNGMAKGEPHVPDSKEPGASGTLHAELNAIAKCDFNIAKKKHMYVTHAPCRMCSRLCINANISRVVYGEAYRDMSGLDILRAGKVEVFHIKDIK